MKTAAFLLFVIAAVLAFPVAVHSETAHYRHDGKYLLPDPAVTPGVVNPALVADLSGARHMVNGVEANLCAKDFRTGPWRKVDESEKKKTCVEYGIKQGCPGKAYEIDHDDSLLIGGSDAIGNLWPQPIDQARIKDHQVEDPLPKLICGGKISLKEAQSCISSDWVKCMVRIKQLEGTK